jgi:nucleoside-diphosphate-sugar epimerase
MQRVLVLGGDEYIGGRVLLALAASDWARPMADLTGAKWARQADIEAVRFDATNPASLSSALSGVDAVVNCLSGRPSVIAAAASALFGTAARCTEPPLIVHISSMSVYGSAVGDISEDAPLHDSLGSYARAKVEAERVAAHYARKVILRPGCEYGPGGELWSGRIAKWLLGRRIGDLGAGGDGYCNLVHIDDLVAAAMLSLRQPAAVGGIFNLGMPDPPTWNEYFARYAKALGAVPMKRISRRWLSLETKVLAVPLKVLEIAAQRVGVVPFLPPPIPPSLLLLARQEIRLDSARARRVLGWECRPLEQGLAETAAWFAKARSTQFRAGLQ